MYGVPHVEFHDIKAAASIVAWLLPSVPYLESPSERIVRKDNWVGGPRPSMIHLIFLLYSQDSATYLSCCLNRSIWRPWPSTLASRGLAVDNRISFWQGTFVEADVSLERYLHSAIAIGHSLEWQASCIVWSARLVNEWLRRRTLS